MTKMSELSVKLRAIEAEIAKRRAADHLARYNTGRKKHKTVKKASHGYANSISLDIMPMSGIYMVRENAILLKEKEAK